jgi:hypothetical protein
VVCEKMWIKTGNQKENKKGKIYKIRKNAFKNLSIIFSLKISDWKQIE